MTEADEFPVTPELTLPVYLRIGTGTEEEIGTLTVTYGQSLEIDRSMLAEFFRTGLESLTDGAPDD